MSFPCVGILPGILISWHLEPADIQAPRRDVPFRNDKPVSRNPMPAGHTNMRYSRQGPAAPVRRGLGQTSVRLPFKYTQGRYAGASLRPPPAARRSRRIRRQASPACYALCRAENLPKTMEHGDGEACSANRAVRIESALPSSLVC